MKGPQRMQTAMQWIRANAQPSNTFAEDLRADQRDKAKQLHSRQLERDIRKFEAWQRKEVSE
jgi:hypothetical protein